jgi:hypothetical protein
MLTEARCKSAKPGQRPDGSPKRLLLSDGSNLCLQVDQGAKGVTRSWIYRYSIAGKSRAIGLGSYPEVSLADARNAAAIQRAIRAARKDPLLEKRREREELEAKIRAEKEEQLVKVQAEKAAKWTFAYCAETYIDAKKAGWKNPKSEAAWRGTLRTYASPVIGSKDVADVNSADVLECVRPIWLAHTTTARTSAAASS